MNDDLTLNVQASKGFRLGGVNEVLAVLLLAAKFGIPVCPHAGGLDQAIGFMLAEIAVFVWVGKLIGALSVVLLVILSGLFGAALIRRQGFKTLPTALLSERALRGTRGAPRNAPRCRSRREWQSR